MLERNTDFAWFALSAWTMAWCSFVSASLRIELSAPISKKADQIVIVVAQQAVMVTIAESDFHPCGCEVSS